MRFHLANSLSQGLQGLVLVCGWEQIQEVLIGMGDDFTIEKLVKKLAPDKREREELKSIIELDISIQAERIGGLQGENEGNYLMDIYPSGEQIKHIFNIGKSSKKGVGIHSLMTLAHNYPEEVSSLLLTIDSVDDDIYQGIEVLSGEINGESGNILQKVELLFIEIDNKIKKIIQEEDELLESSQSSIMWDMKEMGDIGITTDIAVEVMQEAQSRIKDEILSMKSRIEERKKERISSLEEIKKGLKGVMMVVEE